MFWCFRIILDHLQSMSASLAHLSPFFSNPTDRVLFAPSSVDAPATSLSNDVNGSAPPLVGALFTVISRLLAGRIDDCHHTAFIPTDTGQSPIHQPNRSWNSRLVGGLSTWKTERWLTINR